MELKFQRDFFIRPVRGSDQAEVEGLIRKYQSPESAGALSRDFGQAVQRTDDFFRVILNSNGVLIGVLRVSHGLLDLLAVNPNFKKKELKEALFLELREWTMAHSGGKLRLAPKLMAGDWKAFFKQAGAKIEFDPPEGEWLEF